ncbi:MAG: hypothetical protein PF444_05580 [Bacteroidales bacterium]|jgi:hypothetical protein|nr:hypothetical protein [Bacteroidales bacterium]
MKQLKLLSFVVLMTVLLIPQSTIAGTKLGGVRAGYLNSVFYDNGNQGDAVSSFYVGIFRDKQIIPLISLRSGLEYIQLGGDNILGADYEIHTLSVPVSARIKLGPISGLAGVSANFNISSDGGTQDVNVFDYPLHLGLGFNILMVGIEARYNWGMNDVFENSSLKSNYLQVGATIAF